MSQQELACNLAFNRLDPDLDRVRKQSPTWRSRDPWLEAPGSERLRQSCARLQLLARAMPGVELPTDGGARLGTPGRWPHNLSRRTVATGAMLDQFGPDVQGNSPFIVGVSGHRDLDPAELPRLKDAVAAFVTQLKSYLPDTEVHMVVGMAPGADLLVV